MISNLAGVFFGLSSALFYGGADFYGGYATRRHHQYQVLVLSSLTGALLLFVLALLWRESFPSARSLGWATLAGIAGMFGLALLYFGLASGSAAMISPVAGVVGAALPVVYAALTAGLPSTTQICGFAVALPGIWMTTLGTSATLTRSRSGLLLGTISGVGFGLFFIFVARIDAAGVFGPLAASKLVSCGCAVCLTMITRLKLPSITDNPVAIGVGVLDPLANVFYLLSSQFTRLDNAAVLASLYPAGTVMLSWLVFKEQVAFVQIAGIALCLVAIVLITL